MKRIRILMAKAGLDGHDRGIKVVSRALRDAGFEVIYTGLHQTPEMIVESAVQEDVNLVGISVLSGAHMTVFPKIFNLLKEKGMDDIVVFGGGIIPLEDMEKLEKIGVEKLFGPGTPTSEIIEWTR
ncbi:MAG: cobalamin B12-binding domain-containing protein, partial [Candidatus Cloacimonadota bacterium]